MTLNSYQDIASEESALHLCLAGISNTSDITRTRLGHLVCGLGYSGVQSGCQGLGVCRENQKISTIHQDLCLGRKRGPMLENMAVPSTSWI